METEAASTAVRTQTPARCVAATRSMLSTRTAGHALVSRLLCRASTLAPPCPPRGALVALKSASTPPCPHFQEGSLRETGKCVPHRDDGNPLWRHQGHSARRTRCPCLVSRSVFCRPPSSTLERAPGRWSVGGGRCVYLRWAASIPEAQVPPLL